jgi:hypothetical protein
MAIQKEEVSIDVQDIIELLHSGYTWYKKDDLGYGSIQEKYNALDMHIKVIQKHPELQNVDTIARVFVITNNKQNASLRQTTSTPDATPISETLAEVPRGSQDRFNLSKSVPTNDEGSVSNVSQTADEELAAFANL